MLEAQHNPMPTDNEATQELNVMNRSIHASLQANGNEVGQLVARLCQLLPVGTDLMFKISVQGTAKIVTAQGQGIVGGQAELIHISRPVSFAELSMTMTPRREVQQ